MHETNVVGLAADLRVYCPEHTPEGAEAAAATVDTAMRCGRDCARCGRDLVGAHQAQMWRLQDDLADAEAHLASSPHLIGPERRQAEDAVEDAVRALASWADVGRQVGITRQSAHERWGGPR